MLKESSSRLQLERGMCLQAMEEVTRYLVEHGCPDPTLGARPLRGVIRKLVEEPLAEAILQGKYHSGDCIRVASGESGIEFERVDTPSQAPLN